MSKKDNFNQAMYDMFGVGKDNSAAAAPAAESKPTDYAYAAPQSRVSDGPAAPMTDRTSAAPMPDRTSAAPVMDRTSAAPMPDRTSAAPMPARPSVAPMADREPSAPVMNRPVAPAANRAPAAQMEGRPAVRVSPYSAPASSAGAPSTVTYLAPGVELEGKMKATGDVEIAGDFKGEIVTEGSVIIRNAIDATITAAGLQVLNSTLNGETHITGQVMLDENSTVNGDIYAGNMVCSAIVNGNLFIEGDLTLDTHARVKGNVTTTNLTMARGAKIVGHIEMKDMD